MPATVAAPSRIDEEIFEVDTRLSEEGRIRSKVEGESDRLVAGLAEHDLGGRVLAKERLAQPVLGDDEFVASVTKRSSRNRESFGADLRGIRAVGSRNRLILFAFFLIRFGRIFFGSIVFDVILLGWRLLVSGILFDEFLLGCRIFFGSILIAFAVGALLVEVFLSAPVV